MHTDVSYKMHRNFESPVGVNRKSFQSLLLLDFQYEINGESDQVFLAGQLAARGGGSYWVGLNDNAVEGEFVWEHTHNLANFTAWGI